MKASFWTKLRPGNYARELSVVIIGVAVTLLASAYINSCNDKRDLKSQLQIVYDELRENDSRLDKLLDYYNKHENMQTVLRQYMPYGKPVPIDSLVPYLEVINKMVPFEYKHSAYDMFVGSGSMRELSDRKLLMDITESYSLISLVKDKHDNEYNALKQELLTDIFRNGQLPNDNTFDINATVFRPLLLSIEQRSGNRSYIEDAKAQIEKTLSEGAK
jgi:hypothetical protein